MKKKMKRFEAGGLSDAQEEWLGGADRSDPIIMARMRAAVPDVKKETTADNDPYGATKKETSADLDPYNAASKSSTNETPKKAATKASKPAAKSEFKPLTDKDEEGNKLPKDVKKPFIAIPKNAAGMQQYRDDAESPMGKLFRTLTGSKSQRTAAAEKSEKKMRSGGSVSSASSRGDGCAVRGKTKGRMV
jgi:hypothetical protein